VIPGAAPAIWKMLRRDGDVTEFHIGTLPLTLWSAETEAYVAGLAESPPAVYAILRPKPGDRPFDLLTVTASPFEAQDYADNGEDVVEKIPMPPGLEAWIRDFVTRHHVEEPFIKRKRGPKDEAPEVSLGDPRIAQVSDVYRSPAERRKARMQ